MNKYIKYLAASFLIVAIGCTDKFEEYNTPINAVDDIPLELRFNTLTQNFNHAYTTAFIVAQEYSQLKCYEASTVKDYEFAGYNDGYWNRYDKLSLIFDLLERTEGEEGYMKGYQALVNINYVYTMLSITDMYGDVPYTEAGNGEEWRPAYDTQESIYTDGIRILDEACATLENVTIESLGENDRIYGGDASKWLKFANTLRLRIALRIKNVNPTLSSELAQKAFSKPLIENEDESATLPNFDIEGARSGVWNYYETAGSLLPSERVVEFMKSNNDPRLSILITKNVDDEYLGYPNGSNITRPTTEYSDFAATGYAPDMGDQILMYAEASFLKAEAYLFGIGVTANETSANEEYRAGVRANMEMLGVENADIDTFLAGSLGNLSGDQENKIKMIAEQKWLAFFHGGNEAYNEVRRLGYPVIEKRDGATHELGETNGEMPRRLKYPIQERDYNSTHYQTAVAATDNNSFLHKVWWDKN